MIGMVGYWVFFSHILDVKPTIKIQKPTMSITTTYILTLGILHFNFNGDLSPTRTITDYFFFQAGCMISRAATTCRSISPECSSPSRERCWWCCRSSRRYNTCARRRTRRTSSNCPPWTTSNRSAELSSV